MNKLTLITLALVGLSLSACGYLDEDMALSDEEFAASLDGGVRSQHLYLGEEVIRIGGVGYGYSSYSSSHGSYGHHWGRRAYRASASVGSVDGASGEGVTLGYSGGVIRAEEEERGEERELGVEDAFLLNHALVEEIARRDRETLEVQGL